MDSACQASLSITDSQSPPKPMSIESVMPSNHIILCRPLLLLPSVLPSIRVFSNVLAFSIRWPKYWSFSISPSMNIQCWIPLGFTGLISLPSKGLSRVFFSITICRHHFFSTHPSLWASSHIYAWLLGKLYLWLYRPSSTEWCLCLLICCLGCFLRLIYFFLFGHPVADPACRILVPQPRIESIES